MGGSSPYPFIILRKNKNCQKHNEIVKIIGNYLCDQCGYYFCLFVFLQAVLETIHLNPLVMSPFQSLSLSNCATSFSFLTWIRILGRLRRRSSESVTQLCSSLRPKTMAYVPYPNIWVSLWIIGAWKCPAMYTVSGTYVQESKAISWHWPN